MQNKTEDILIVAEVSCGQALLTSPSPLQQHQNALERWDSEGGAGPEGPQTWRARRDEICGVVPLANAELVQLRIRVIALENILIALLAEGSERQNERALAMAKHIVPRPGFTRHPLTIQAASHMLSLVERSNSFKTVETASNSAHAQKKPDDIE